MVCRSAIYDGVVFRLAQNHTGYFMQNTQFLCTAHAPMIQRPHNISNITSEKKK